MPGPLIRALRNLDAWVDHFSRIEIPVLPETAAALAALAEDEDRADAQGIARIVLADPLMCVKVYRLLASLRRGTQVTDVENITGCVLMLGLGQFFRRFADQPTLPAREDLVASERAGLDAVLERARRASDFAFDWALRRDDMDAEVIATAALTHDFAEMLLWCAAPALAVAIRERQALHPGMRSADAQREVLGVTINELQHALLRRWRLPALLVRMTDDHAATDSQTRNVALAVALARHSAHGWSDPALPDDYLALADLLNVTPGQARTIAGVPL
jgi:HD-like signal output (HDOD) protein